MTQDRLSIGRKRTGFRSGNLGEIVKFHRTKLGMTQQELAEGICADTFISAIESNKTGVSIELLTALADRLGVPLQEFHSDEFSISAQLDLVDVHIKRGEFEAAQEVLDEVRQREMWVEHRLKWHLLQAELWNDTSRMDETIRLVTPLLLEVETRHNTEIELTCKLYNELGIAYFRSRKLAQSYSAYDRGLTLARRLNSFGMTTAILSYNLAVTCNELEMRNDAKVYLDDARKFFESVSDLEKLAHACFHSAIATGDESYLVMAKHLYTGLKMFDLLNQVRQREAFYVKAKQDYKTAIEELHTIATDFANQNDFERCVFTLARAIILCVYHSDLVGAQVYLSLANIYKSKLASEEGQYIPYYYLAAATYYLAENNYSECMKNAYKASNLYANMEMNVYASESLEIVVSALERQEMFREALDVSKKANQLLKRNGGTSYEKDHPRLSDRG